MNFTRANLGLRIALSLFAGAVMLSWTTSGKAQVAPPNAAATFTADPQLVELGARMFKETVPCRDCHGAMGDGVPDDPRMPKGANFRVMTLTPDEAIEAIRCGRPSVGMPYFDRLSYTDKRCYGVTAEEIGNGIPDEGMNLQTRQINALVQYIFSTYVGKGPANFEQCTTMWGAGATSCARYPKGN